MLEIFQLQGSLVPILDSTLLTENDLKQLTIDGKWISRRANCLPLQLLVHCVVAVFDWDLCPSDAEMRKVCDWKGALSWLSSGRECARGVVAATNLKDSFCLFHDDAIDRFTCWNQSRNARFSNDGSRIDFILVDPAINVAKGDVPLYGSGTETNSSAKDAWNAATAFGQWKPVKEKMGGIGTFVCKKFQI
jgi:hypothetical protein